MACDQDTAKMKGPSIESLTGQNAMVLNQAPMQEYAQNTMGVNQAPMGRPPMATENQVNPLYGANYGKPLTIGQNNIGSYAGVGSVGQQVTPGSTPFSHAQYDLDSYFAGPRTEGETMDWAGGKLTYHGGQNGNNGYAVYTNPQGGTTQFSGGQPVGQIAQSDPNIAGQWNKQYGGGFGGNFAASPTQSVTAGLSDQYQPAQGMATPAAASTSGTNPYLDQMAAAIGQQARQQWDRQLAPAIRGNAISAGGFGGSRQGIAEGIALGDLNQGITNSLANLYGQSYESQQNRDLQRQMQQAQLAQQGQQFGQNLDWQKHQFGKTFGEGQRQFDIGQGNWNDQFNMQNLLAGQQLANQQSMLPYQQLQILSGLGGQLQNQQQQYNDADINNLLKYASILQPGAGLGATTSGTQTGPGQSRAGGVLGGAAAGASLGSIIPGLGTGLGAIGGGLLGLFG